MPHPRKCRADLRQLRAELDALPRARYGQPAEVVWPWDARYCFDVSRDDVAKEFWIAEQAYRIAMSRPDRRRDTQ